MKKQQIIAMFLLLAFSSCVSSPQRDLSPSSTKPATTQSETILPTPQTSESMGALKVVLQYPTGKPLRHQNIYLAALLPVEQGQGYVPALDPVTAPKGSTTEDGGLVLSLVPPGKYALILMTPLGPIMLENVDTLGEITFQIEAGKITDLHTIQVQVDPETLGE